MRVGHIRKYRCRCGWAKELYLRVGQHVGLCPECGNELGSDAPRGSRVFSPYYEPNLGCWITSPRHRARILAERNLDTCSPAEYVKHVRDVEHKPAPLTTVDEVAKTLALVKEKMRDPDYRHAMEAFSRGD